MNHLAPEFRNVLWLVIVEGFFGCMKLHQHGCRKVVALMGITAMQWVEGILWLDGPTPHGTFASVLASWTTPAFPATT